MSRFRCHSCSCRLTTLTDAHLHMPSLSTRSKPRSSYCCMVMGLHILSTMPHLHASEIVGLVKCAPLSRKRKIQVYQLVSAYLYKYTINRFIIPVLLIVVRRTMPARGGGKNLPGTEYFVQNILCKTECQ